MRISLLINCDTRPEKNEAGAMFDGIRSWDFLTDGVRNKKKFFEGFDFETVVWVDEHVPIPNDILETLRSEADRLVISKHTKRYKDVQSFNGFNDINYIQTLALSRGEITVHVDQDMAMFVRGKSHVDNLIKNLDTYSYVSYPTDCSPRCVNDPSFGDHVWASTRFFMCKKDTVNLTELEQAVWEPETLYAKYHRPKRELNWVEHFLGVSCRNSVFYPPLSNDLLVFPWHRYVSGTLSRLNSAPFDQINMKLVHAGAGSYHGCDSTRLMP